MGERQIKEDISVSDVKDTTKAKSYPQSHIIRD